MCCGLHHLAQRRMGMDDGLEILHRSISVHQRTDFLNQVGCMCSKQVTTEDVSLAVGQELTHAVRLIHADSLAIGAEERFLGHIGNALRLTTALPSGRPSQLRET